MRKEILSVISAAAGVAAGAGVTAKKEREKTKKAEQLADKHFNLYMLMNQWVKIKQENKSIAKYLEENGYKEIAIYGLHFVGETLVSELEDSGITIKYGIDQNANDIYEEFDVLSPEDDLEEVDAVIVTPITFFDEIEDMLMDKLDCPIISLEDILYEI